MKCPYPITIRSPVKTKPGFIHVPCGDCAICVKNTVNMWKIRLTEESKRNVANCFVTLTYNDEEVPLEGVLKSDVQNFIKRLRKYGKLRYYAISEYGPSTYRPHYHLILFGFDSNSLPKRKEQVDKIWGKGFVTLENISPGRVNYIAEYHVWKYNYPDGQNENFKLMSTKPPIGINYIKDQVQFHWSENEMYYRQNGFRTSLPRIYKERLYPKFMIEKAKLLNERYQDEKELTLAMTKKNYYVKRQQDLKKLQEEYLKRKTKNRKL